MNQSHLKFICSELQLGTPIGEVTSVEGSRGGSFIWSVNTDKATYAIKQLSPAIDLKNEKMVEKYELSETIAGRFAREGIPAISAIEKSGKHLIIMDNTGYLVYPWVEGYVLGRNEVSESHALKIAEIIAKLHSINMNVPEALEPRVETFSNNKIIEAIDKAVSFKCPFAMTLKENKSLILSMNDRYQDFIPLLLQDTVVTHGDLNQLNILWDKAHQPILIDWESVRKLNPTREIVLASIGWSGMVSDKSTALPIYTRMLRTYIKSGGVINVDHLHAAFYSSIGSMVFWMLYNIEIACTSDAVEARATAISEVDGVMMGMSKFNILVPDLLKLSVENSS